jgi:hypothetical protein
MAVPGAGAEAVSAIAPVFGPELDKRCRLLTAVREFRVAAGDPAFCARTAFLRAGVCKMGDWGWKRRGFFQPVGFPSVPSLRKTTSPSLGRHRYAQAYKIVV